MKKCGCRPFAFFNIRRGRRLDGPPAKDICLGSRQAALFVQLWKYGTAAAVRSGGSKPPPYGWREQCAPGSRQASAGYDICPDCHRRLAGPPAKDICLGSCRQPFLCSYGNVVQRQPFEAAGASPRPTVGANNAHRVHVRHQQDTIFAPIATGGSPARLPPAPRRRAREGYLPRFTSAALFVQLWKCGTAAAVRSGGSKPPPYSVALRFPVGTGLRTVRPKDIRLGSRRMSAQHFRAADRLILPFVCTGRRGRRPLRSYTGRAG